MSPTQTGTYHFQSIKMNIDLTTPALLFSTISLLLLAYTNRFLALAKVIRTLHREYRMKPDPLAAAQIVFAISLVLMVGSLTISLVEIRMSVGALNLQLSDMEER